MTEETIGREMMKQGYSRRDFLKFCGMLAAAAGMPGSARLAAQVLRKQGTPAGHLA